MSYKQAREYVRTHLIASAEFNRLSNIGDRYFRKLPHNRPPVTSEPTMPTWPEKTDQWDTTALHVVYNYLKGKPNCHPYKDRNTPEACRTSRQVRKLIEFLAETFQVEVEEVRSVPA